MLGLYHLNALFKIQREMFLIHDEEEICSYVLEETRIALYAQAGTFFLVNPKTNMLAPVSAIGASLEQLKKVNCRVGVGICGWVAEHLQGIIVDNPDRDNRFLKSVDVVTGIKTKNIICSAIHLRGQVLGVIELMNRTDSGFKQIDLEFLDIIAQQTAVALESARLYSEVSSLAAFKESMLESLTGGFIAIDKKGVVTEFNPAARNILSLNPADVIGRNYIEAFGAIAPLQEIITTFIQDSQPKKRQEYQYAMNNSTRRIGYGTFLIVSKTKDIIGYGMTFQDLTNLK